jgi:hypothetical protein
VNSTARLIRSQIAVAQRLRPHDTEALNALRRDFAAARLEEAILRTLSEVRLTDEQREQLARLLTARGAA